MVTRRFVILRRKPGMSVEQFRNYWQNVYGPLFAKVPGIVKYIQYHVHSEVSDNKDDPIDGIAEFWFASEEAQRKAYQTPEYQAVLEIAHNLVEMNTHYIHPVMTDEIIEMI